MSVGREGEPGPIDRPDSLVACGQFVAVPDSFTVCGDAAPSSEMVTFPVWGPAVAGSNTT